MKLRKPAVDYTKLRLHNIKSLEYRHVFYLLGWVGYLIMFVLTERLVSLERCHVIHSRIDDLIPFIEYFAIFYVSWFPFLVVSLLYFLLYDVNSFVHAERLLIGMQVIAICIYIFWPSVQYLRPDHFERSNVCTRIMNWFYTIDTPTGVCPSLHVGFALACMSGWIWSKTVNARTKLLMIAWTIGISASVCFVKQHSFVDVCAALILYAVLEILLVAWEAKTGRITQLPRLRRREDSSI